MIKIGEINSFKVKKITDIAYMLESGEEEIFMHFNDASKTYEVGDIVDAFVFYDFKKRVAATTFIPYITLSKPGLVKVITVEPFLGVFIDNNISKDFLISKDDLKLDFKSWPQIGDKLYCILKLKNNGLFARLLRRNEVNDFYDSNICYQEEEVKEGYVQYIGEAGLNVFTIDNINVFVHKTNYRGTYHLGQFVKVTIKHKNERDYNGSLIERKEFMIDSDSKLILDKLLNKFKGKMPFNANSSSEEILNEFSLSRKAFKRALGHLYKEQLIYFEENFTIKKDDNNGK